MSPTKSALAQCLVSATLACVAQAAWAAVPNASCSSGIAKTPACQGGNKVGQTASNDASCCEVKPAASAKPPPEEEPGGRGAPRGFYNTKADISPPALGSTSAMKPPPGSQTGPRNPNGGAKDNAKAAIPPPGFQTGPTDPTSGDKAASKVAPMSHGYYK